MKNAEWNNLRTRLYHDWLQNRYLTFLKSWEQCLDDKKQCELDIDDVLDKLLQWRKKREEFLTLINECETALSPQQLLYEPPLDNMSDDDKQWLGDVIHALYCSRTGIRDKVVSLQSMLHEVDKCVDAVAEKLRGENRGKDSAGNKIISVFVSLSKEISELPHDIQVV